MNHEIIKNRFYEKFTILENGCWVWTAGGRGVGYGCIKVDGKVIDAHRVSFMLHKGEIPKGLYVCHTCDNRKCVNPEHLFLGTQSDNMKDCSQKGRIYRFPKEFLRSNGIKNNQTKKLSVENILDIRQRIIKGETLLEIGNRYGVHKAQVSRIKSGKAWSWVQ